MFRNSSCVAVVGAAFAWFGGPTDAFAFVDCPTSNPRDKIVIVPIKGADTPNSAMMTRANLIAGARTMRDWYEEVSYGCYRPNIWVDQPRALPQPYSSYTTSDQLKTAINQVVGTIEPFYGLRTTKAHYVAVVMGTERVPWVADTVASCDPLANGQMNVYACTHELNHLLGLDDLRVMDCPSGERPFGTTPWGNSTTCDGDRQSGAKVSIQGSSNTLVPMHLTGVEKDYLGFVQPGKITSFSQKSTADQELEVQLYTASKEMAESPQLLRISLSRGSSSTPNLPPFYWVEYRTADGFDQNIGTSRDMLHIYYQSTFGPTIHYRSPPNGSRAALGATFSDPFTGIKITLASTTGERANVKLTIPRF
jgi:hypothetical protein